MPGKRDDKDYSEKFVDNFKKAVTELLILTFLSKRDMTIFEILTLLDKKSDSICKIQYPYGVIYRMSDRGFIEIAGKAVSDERRRIHYRITDSGREYLQKLTNDYERFQIGLKMIFEYINSMEDSAGNDGEK